MKHVSVGMSLTPSAGRTCVRPTGRAECGKPVRNQNGVGEERFLCQEHFDIWQEIDRKSREEKIAWENSLPRRTIERRVDAVIPALYQDVRPLPAMDDPTFEEKRRILYRRLRFCADIPGMLQAASNAANLILSERGAVVFLTGETSVGKTTLVALILRILVDRIPLERWSLNPATKVGALFDDTPGVWPMTKPGQPDDPKILWASADMLFELACAGEAEVFKHVPLAVIDDIGGEGTQANVKSTVSFVWARYDSMKSSIVTSGFVDPQSPRDMWPASYFKPLETRYGAAFVRRIAEPDQERLMHIHVPKKMG